MVKLESKKGGRFNGRIPMIRVKFFGTNQILAGKGGSWLRLEGDIQRVSNSMEFPPRCQEF